MKSNKYYIVIILICLLIIAVVIIVTKSKKEYYLTRGKKSYEKHCANCHGKMGKGIQLLIPPLTDATWLENDSIVCIIKNGMEGNIMVNGKNFNGRMTGNHEIDQDEIADLVSYIRHDFIKKPKRLTIKGVSEQVLKCK